MSSDPSQVRWIGEQPLPETNLQILASIYVLEQWLRRIALAALMAKGGSSWSGLIPSEIHAEGKKQVALLRKRTYLEPENSDNLVWALTLEQLRVVLTDPSLESFVFDLTGLSRTQLASQLEKLRDIRNVVAHNRATSDVALENLRLVERKLNEGIQRFKRELIYIGFDRANDESGEVVLNTSVPPAEGPVRDAFEASALASGRIYNLYARGRFFEFGTFAPDPISQQAPYITISRAIDAAHEIRHRLLAVILSRPGSESTECEFAVSWPCDVTRDEQLKIRDFTLTLTPDTDVPYTAQDPRYVCDPLIWFEGGWEGSTAAGFPFPFASDA